MQRSLRVLGSLLIVGMLVPNVVVHGASAFAVPQFQTQWQTGEAITPNFWGPLDTAHEGRQEPYTEASGGQRLVQYFDKARMELTNGKLTNGLLTVELMSGRLQRGDNTFEQRTPARIDIAGDPGSDSVTYADLSRMPKKTPNADASTTAYEYKDGQFSPLMKGTQSPWNNEFFTYLGDPGGQIGQYVWKPFAAFIAKVPTDGVGYPITPLFYASFKVGGQQKTVFVQAFERRVLTLLGPDSGNGSVEFGNIGQHYFQWRYGTGASNASATAAIPAMPSPNAMATVTKQSTQSDYSLFAKRWGHHGYQLIVSADGSAHEDYRTYNDCSMSRPSDVPYEDPYTSYAAHTTMQFTNASNGTATGKILTSNYPREEMVGDVVTLTLKPYDMAEFKVGSREPMALCGPDYARLAPPDIINQSPCGA